MPRYEIKEGLVPLDYPESVSRNAQRAFLNATTFAIVDLMGRDASTGQQFIDDLKLHIDHLRQMAPELPGECIPDQLEDIHRCLLLWIDHRLETLSDMPTEQFQTESQQRSLWRDIYRTLEES